MDVCVCEYVYVFVHMFVCKNDGRRSKLIRIDLIEFLFQEKGELADKDRARIGVDVDHDKWEGVLEIDLQVRMCNVCVCLYVYVLVSVFTHNVEISNFVFFVSGRKRT